MNASSVSPSIPRTLARLPGVRRLPWPGPLALIPAPVERAAAEVAVNRALAPQLADGDVDFLEGRSLRIRIPDIGCDWLVTKAGSRLTFRAGRDEAEATFAGDARSLLLLAARREDPDTLFFQRRLDIEGDTELGLQVKNLIDSIDFDDLPAPLIRALGFSAAFAEALPGADAA
ncbi:ubiquinone anaerobic biosynthesis accessory factor UbiT [Pseudohaliea rubra]|uniref:Ubiquinone biosynthesis accessory factor UbiT n=1 Tax=Pseudohaliea rubra DSM 19751 TaxID=1265313 RepID=A0A095VTP9_9GAMM|nr:SCP2 sterol-binding domain-containing protein [Pseudohaliea rubra]KGE04837.1 putative lipid carrier protein [Pseudohaliea rubra DSM 19751]